jgi:hypothetical protein
LIAFAHRAEIIHADMRAVPPEALEDISAVINLGGY